MANLEKTGMRSNIDPWRDFLSLESFFDRNLSNRSSLPAVNVSEDEKGYEIEVAAPGFNKEDLKINVEDDILTISAESKKEFKENGNGRQYSRREYSYSAFTRSFSLPDNAKDDSITADYKDGILTLHVPKSKTQVKASKEIKIS
jgi:HSP20 family protein